ncbi:MAG: hypothetical protein QG602_3088, partial [Verrucomicrobiota bacterium]|nr:hypothetical protein [Verrucomicrobiota bacterium]
IELAAELAGLGYPCATHSDTEVILRAYECWGDDFVKRLNGMFAIAIIDRRKDLLHLFRDRAGVKPLYYYSDERRLVFGSEIKALLDCDIPAEVDVISLDALLTCNYVPPPRTIYRNVRHLSPGGHMKIHADGRRSEAAWWQLQPRIREDVSEEEAVAEFTEILADAVRIRMRCDVPFGAFLSGGLDSSTIVSLMGRYSPTPIKTFCIGFDDARFDESPFAQLAATRFNTQHHLRLFKSQDLSIWPKISYHNDQPHGDVSFLPTYHVSELAAEQVKVVLTGDGGDELFAGYEKYLELEAGAAGAPGGQNPLLSYLERTSLFTREMKKGLYTPGLLRATAGQEPMDQVLGIARQYAHLDAVNQALAIDFLLLLPGNNLVKPDRMGMAHSIEARTPFLDYRMIEFAFNLPSRFKLHDGRTKHMMRKAIEPLIGRELLNRPKQMFTVPIGEWFKSDGGAYCRRVLFAPDSLASQLFDGKVVEDMIQAHCGGQKNYTRQLRALAAIEIWYQSAPRKPALSLG